ncbi:MAG: O-antigen ligase family protein [Candidatus Falkowbacteria bacterium]|nr:O-antigen ligase family protein [Candidatus Falkowbacteria bacterium]
MLAAMPTYLIRFSAFGLPMTVLELMILISFFVWLVTKTNFKLFIRGQYSWREFKENRLKREKYPWRWEIVALLVISWVAIAVGGFTNGSLGIWKAYFFEPILVFILVLNLFSAQGGSASGGKEKKGIEKIIFALAFSAFAVSVLAIYQKLTGNLIDNPFWSAAATRRAVSFFGYPNAVGLYLGPIIMILVGYFHSVIASPDLSGRGNLEGSELNSGLLRRSTPRNDKIKKSFVALTIVLSLMSIYFAKSEGAIIALLVAFFVFGILAGKKIRWATLIAAIVIGSGVLVYAPARIHVLDLIQLHNFSGQVRTQQWKETRKMLTDGRLIFGAGLANYQKTIKPYHQEGIFVYDFHDPNFHAKLVASDELKKKVWQPTEIYLYPHNILLNFWSELGLAGMLLFIWIFIKFFYLSFGNWKLEIGNSVNQKNKYLILGLVGAMITIIIHGLVDVPYFKNDLSVLFWVMLAMVSLINWQNKSYA